MSFPLSLSPPPFPLTGVFTKLSMRSLSKTCSGYRDSADYFARFSVYRFVDPYRLPCQVLQMRPSSFYNRLNLRDNEDYTVLIAQLISSFREVSSILRSLLVPPNIHLFIPVRFQVPPSDHSLTPQELCTFDDIATSLVVDSVLNFQTHKMFPRLVAPHQRGSVQYSAVLVARSEMRSISGVAIWSRKSERRPKPSCGSSSTHRTSNRHSAPSSHSAPFRLCSRVSSRTSEWNSAITWVPAHILLVLSATHTTLQLLRFLNVFCNKTGFTVEPCTRYSAEEHQGARLISTRYWNRGDRIERLFGVICVLDTNEEAQILKPGQNDFSVMYSTRFVCVCAIPATFSLDSTTFNTSERNAHNCGSALQHTLITTA